MTDNLLVYGANGYTGRLIAETASCYGLTPVVAGRDGAAVEAIAGDLGLEVRSFGLDRPDEIDRGITGIDTVLHCAGPFIRTARPMVEACLRKGVHYMDVTGEPMVFDALARLHEEARARKVMLLPGVGFDVVPSDCLAAHLARRLPGASSLRLAFWSTGQPSRGTALTMAENAGAGGLIRRDGKLCPVPAAWRCAEIDFGPARRTCVTIPWGDVVTAFYSTGIKSIEVMMAAPASTRRAMRIGRYLGRLLRSAPFQHLARRAINRRGAGPSAEERAAASTHLWGRATDHQGRSVTSRLHGPDGYTTTARCALELARRLGADRSPPGFQTPSQVLGPDIILKIEGFSREDLQS